jgi:hypothetical protein
MARTATEMKTRAQDLLAGLGPESYERAIKSKKTLSAWLEEQDPSEGYDDGLDAFGRMLEAAGIVTRSIEPLGIYADVFEKFDQSPQTRTLAIEFFAREWRKVTLGKNKRAILLSDDSALGTADRPYFDNDMGMWDRQLAPAIPVSDLVARTTPIEGDAYRAYYLTPDAAQLRLVRVTEAAEIPGMSLVGGDRMVRLYKYGRKLRMSYEQLRRMKIDKVALLIQRMAVQAEVDKVAAIIDVLVNGDGNTNTGAESFDLTELDTDATAGTLTLKAWLAFKMKFTNPYMPLTALAQEATALSLMLLNTGSANIPLPLVEIVRGFGGFRQINPGLADGVALGWTSDAPANKVLLFDPRFAIERLTEIGSTVQEATRYITNQTEVLTMTETEGYAVMDIDSAKILNIAA